MTQTCTRETPHECTVNGPCNGFPKPFQKTPRKVLTVIVDEHGNLEYLKTDGCDVLLELGEAVTRRASHVEPATFWTRVAFHTIRRVVSDQSRVAAWTRTWSCEWRIDTSPVGGPVLTWNDVYTPQQKRQMARVYTTQVEYTVLCQRLGKTATWADRQDAIDAEVKFLNEWFLTRSV